MTSLAGSQYALDSARVYSQSYADVQGLQGIKQLAKTDRQQAIAEVGRQFESMLVQIMMKNMRSATEVLGEGNFLSSQQVSFYQQMLDDQWSVELTRGDGLGLATQFSQSLDGLDGAGATAAPAVAAVNQQQAIDARRLAVTAAGPLTDAANDKADTAQSLTDRLAATVLDVADKVRARLDSLDGDPASFVRDLYPYAADAARQLGVSPAVLLAQAALETGWGQYLPKSADGGDSFNLFGIKADQRWSGDSVTVNTTEFIAGQLTRVSAPFRRYASFAESFSDYVSFVRDQARYASALKAGTNDAQYAEGLQQAGYATDPRYAQKIQQIIARDDFQQSLQFAQRAEQASAGAESLSTPGVTP